MTGRQWRTVQVGVGMILASICGAATLASYQAGDGAALGAGLLGVIWTVGAWEAIGIRVDRARRRDAALARYKQYRASNFEGSDS